MLWLAMARTLQLVYQSWVQTVVDGYPVSVHLLPPQGIHLIENGTCWCGPEIYTQAHALADRIGAMPGIEIWIHKSYTPKRG